VTEEHARHRPFFSCPAARNVIHEYPLMAWHDVAGGRGAVRPLCVRVRRHGAHLVPDGRVAATIRVLIMPLCRTRLWFLRTDKERVGGVERAVPAGFRTAVGVLPLLVIRSP
jgi:hypothetical protein